MSKVLLEKLRRARETKVEADGHVFTVRRPTDAELSGLANCTTTDLVRRFVVGWDLQEVDIIPGGDAVAVPFDGELWSEWIADRPTLWGPLSLGVMEAYSRHVEEREQGKKN
jgi:hypothetical protein